MNEETVSMEATETMDGFLEGFDDTDGAVMETDQPTEEAQEEERQTTEQPAETAASEEPTAEEAAGGETRQATGEEPAPDQKQEEPTPAPRQWQLRHMDETRTVGEEEMTALAQKGLDYDRIRAKYDESKPVMELFRAQAAKAGMNMTDYITHLRVNAKMADRRTSEDDARRAVALEDRETAVSIREAEQNQAQQAANAAAQGKAAEEASRKADLERFRTVFPDVAKDPKGIPPEVWSAVQGGLTLVEAYSKYAVAKAQQSVQAAEQKATAAAQNQKNAARSTGSMKSAGESVKSKDPFLEGWGE